MDALRKCWIPLQEAQLQENPWQGSFNLFVDDLFGTGGKEMEQRVLARLSKDFQVGSEDWNDVIFTGQRIRCTKDPQTGSHIEFSQEKAIEELEEIPVERNTKEDFHCTLAMQCIQDTQAFWDK